MVIGGVINIVACAIGTAVVGAIGVAVATAATSVVWNLAMAIDISKRVNVTAGLRRADPAHLDDAKACKGPVKTKYPPIGNQWVVRRRRPQVSPIHPFQR